MLWPIFTVPPLSRSVPVVGSAVMMTLARAFGGLSNGSKADGVAEAKLAVVRIKSLSSKTFVAVEVMPTGGLLSAVTLTVIVLGFGSVSTPEFAVPPLSCTRNGIVATALPLTLAGGV